MNKCPHVIHVLFDGFGIGSKSRLDEITKQEQVLDELPRLRQTLLSTYDDLKSRLSVLDILQPGTPIGEFLREAEIQLREQNELRRRERQERIVEGKLLASGK